MSDDNDDEMIEVLVRKMMNVIEIMIGKKIMVMVLIAIQ